MNSLALATQISWTLQSAIGVAFAAALIGLAVELKRPAAQSLAVAWALTVIGLFASTGLAYFDPALRAPGLTMLFGALTIAGVSGSVPAFENAVAIMSGAREPVSTRALFLRSLKWVLALSLLGVVLVLLGTGPLKSLPWFTGVTGRLVIVAAYLLLTITIVRSRHQAAPSYRGVLTLMACAAAMQALRPVIVIAYLTRGEMTAITDADALSFIGTHVFTVSIMGVASLLLALAEERSSNVATGRQLRDAALRVERSHRLESVGRLASGVAHDFNNLLTVITSSVSLARDARGREDVIDEELREIEKAATRGAQLTAQLLAFARQQPQHVIAFDANDRLRQMASLLERLTGNGAALCLHASKTPTLLLMDPVRFEQIVLNLVSNARNAITDTGTINVVLGERDIPAKTSNGDALPAGRYASLTVSDNGRGISEDVRENLFEPFFTTRQSEGGTGLGLATVQGIARQVGGDVTVQSVLGQGATFTVLLPVAPGDSASSSH